MYTPVEGDAREIQAPSVEERKMVAQLAEAGRLGNWAKVDRMIRRYTGSHTAVLSAAMQAATRCRKYREGAEVFKRLRQCEDSMDLPAYTVAMKLLGKLGRVEVVEELWSELVENSKVNKVLAQARIDAAASNGDIDAAFDVLRYMEEETVEIGLTHYVSAIDACSKSKELGKMASAHVLFKEIMDRGLTPNIITYTNLLRASRDGSDEDLLALLANMKTAGVKADAIFVENLILAFVKKPAGERWTSSNAVAQLKLLPSSRLENAKMILADFREQGIHFNKVCVLIEDALAILRPE